MNRTMTSNLSTLLGLLLATPLAACEYSKQLDEDGDDSSGTDSSAADTGAGGTNVTGATGMSSTSATSVSATGGEATSTSVGPGGSDDTSGGDDVCGPDEARLSLMLDGDHATIFYEVDGYASSAIGTHFYLDDEAAIHLRAEHPGDGPSSAQGGGYVRLPPGALDDEESWFCFDDTSTLQVHGNDANVLQMNGLSDLGACADGVPVEGSISACLGDPSCGGEYSVRGIIGTDALEETSGGFGTNENGGYENVAIDVGGQPTNSGGQLGFRVGPVDEDGGLQQLPLERPYFIVPLGHPDGGAVYCAGEGSTATYDGGFIVSVELAGLSRVGSCADEAGTGSGMFCSHSSF